MDRSKKIAILITCIVVLLIAGGLLHFIRPVDGSGRYSSIKAKAFPSENVLELRLSNRSNPGDFLAYGGQHFSSRKSLVELEEICKEQGVSTVYSMSMDGLLLCRENAEGYQDHYLIQFSDYEHGYLFTGIYVTVNAQKTIPYPLHLTTDLRLKKTASANIREHMPYEFEHEAEKMYQDILEFYNGIGYTVQERSEGDAKILQIKPSEAYAENQAFELTIVKDLITTVLL